MTNILIFGIGSGLLKVKDSLDKVELRCFNLNIHMDAKYDNCCEKMSNISFFCNEIYECYKHLKFDW